MGCLFCRIVNKEVPADIVLETDKILAFKDISPQAPVHILVIPKQHFENILDMHEKDPEAILAINQSFIDIASQFGLATNGFRIVTNIGTSGGQTVFHLHFHLLGGRDMNWPPG